MCDTFISRQNWVTYFEIEVPKCILLNEITSLKRKKIRRSHIDKHRLVLSLADMQTTRSQSTANIAQKNKQRFHKQGGFDKQK
jgi:phage FluMu protein Com